VVLATLLRLLLLFSFSRSLSFSLSFSFSFYIVWGIWLRQCLNGKADEYELVWPSWFGSIPRVVKREFPEGMNGAANGDVKKTS